MVDGLSPPNVGEAPAGLGHRLPIWVAAAFGFLLQLNIIPAAFGSRFLHVTDPIVLVGALLLPTVLTRPREQLVGLLCYVPLLLWLLLVICWAWIHGDFDFYLRILIFCYALCGSYLVLQSTYRPLLLPFCIGMVVGAILSIVFLILDVTASLPLSQFGLALQFDRAEVLSAMAQGNFSPESLRLEKAGGLWAAGNEAGPAIALAAPAAAYWSERKSSIFPFLVFFLVYLAGFAFMQNRSGLIAVVIVGGILFFRMFSIGRLVATLWLLPVVAACLLVASFAGAMGGLGDVLENRLMNDSNIDRNVDERMNSTLAGFSIALENPLGISYVERVEEMKSSVGLLTPHNGIITLVYYSGYLFVICLLVSAVCPIVKNISGRIFYIYSIIAFFIGLSFEELHSNPVFLFFAGLIIGYPLAYAAMRWNRAFHMPAASGDLYDYLSPGTKESMENLRIIGSDMSTSNHLNDR